MEKEFDMVAVGNTLMDVLIQVDDEHLAEFNLKKGTFHLIDEEQVNKIIERFKETKQTLTPAGAAANTAMGMANLGGKCLLIGRVGNDPHGSVYEEVITKDKVAPKIIRCTKSGTGRCFTFITSDAERTFAVNLGAAINLEKENVVEEDIKKAKLLYLTGYLIENAKPIALHAMDVAKKNNIQIAIDLADPNLIKRHKEDLRNIVKEFANIVFVNELEAPAFTDKEDPNEALYALAEDCDIAVVKLGKNGSLISHKGEVIYVEAMETHVVDTTGAGDLYAAGFLHGFLQGKELETCGRIGTFLASKVIAQIGARITEPLADKVKEFD